MARTTKKKETPIVVTRAEKKDATKGIIKELLAVKPYKHNELIEETAKLYAERFSGEDTENVNDVKGRVGSVLDIMKKESEIIYDGGMYALKARLPMPPTVETAEEKPAKKTKTRTKKSPEAKAEEVKEEVKIEEVKAEKPARKTAKKTATKSVKKEKEEKQEAPALETTPAPATEEKAEEKPAPKKRATRSKSKKSTATEPEAQAEAVKPEPEAKAETKTQTEAVAEEVKSESPAPVETVEAETKAEEPAKTEEPAASEVKNLPVVKEKAEIAEKSVVMDMSFLFSDVKPVVREQKPAEKPLSKSEETSVPVKEEQPSPVKTEEKPQPSAPIKAEEKRLEKPAPKTENKPAPKAGGKRETSNTRSVRTLKKPVERPLTADEKLCAAFLKRMHALGGDYFEYYSVYLLERYSMKNGRRLEGMRVCGGDHDGGIDGEIELTDKFGFKETIYIQAKNWDPSKGDERLWVVGETLLQQFIGACACKQAKDGKQHSRGIFVTTSRFTPDAKHILETMSDKIIGYDGKDLYEAAKECEFGIVKKNGEWTLDEKLLSGTKAFFNML